MNLELLSPETRSQLIQLAVTYGARIAGALGVLAIAYLIARWLSAGVERLFSARGLDSTVTGFARSATFWTITGLGFVACLSVFGVETTSIAAVVGGAGVGIGLALQGNLANLSSGLLLLVVRPFTAGDWVVIQGSEGRVVEINLFTTSLDTFDNRRIIVPNDAVFKSILENRDHHELRRADLSVGVSYDADLHETIEVLTRALEQVTDRVEDRDILVRCVGFGGSSIDFKLGVWVPREAIFDARHEAHLLVKDALDEANIGIPFPQRVLHLNDGLRSQLLERTELREAS